MKLELNIADDKELRNFVRDYIKGELSGVVRDEIRQATADALAKLGTKHDIERLVDRVLGNKVEAVAKSVTATWNVAKPLREALDARLRELNIENILAERLKTFSITVKPA